MANDHSLLAPLPLLGFVAWSGTGKTTLLEQLIPRLVARGLRIAVLKHAHHDFDIDYPGKDSWRFRQAGASQVIAASRLRHAKIVETSAQEPSFHQLLGQFDHNQLDLLLVEGFKHIAYAKIELHRKALAKPLLYPDDEHIIAIASDSPQSSPLPQLDINDIEGIADFVCSYIAKPPANANLDSPGSPSLGMLSVAQARQTIIASLTANDRSLTLPLPQCLGKVLAQDLISPVNVPPHANSAMDGIGLRSDDLDRKRWQLVGEILAGQMPDLHLAKGQAVQIMTGAPLPAGVDTVVMREEAQIEGDWVQINTAIKAGQHVRQAGEDLAKGAQAIAAGTRLNAAHLGLAASLGNAELYVRAPLRVALFSTGDEVQAPGTARQAGHIFDSNRFTLMSQLQCAGCEIIDLGIVADNPAALRQTLSQGADQADMIISSGGVSVGNADFIKTVLEEVGQIDFWKIQMRPGRPLAFGHIAGVPFFGLPGNPVASMICFMQFVEPAIAHLQQQIWQPMVLRAYADEVMKSRLGRSEFLRGVFYCDQNGHLRVRTTGPQGSGILSSMSEANCLIELQPNQERAQLGESVLIHPLQGRF